jgi:hypothetical protein
VAVAESLDDQRRKLAILSGVMVFLALILVISGNPVLYVLAAILILFASVIGWTVGSDHLQDREIRRRRTLGLYLKCGYDLHGTPNQCPECGAVREDRQNN